MDGVEILNTIDKVSAFTIIIIIACTLFAIFLTICAVCAFKSKDKGYGIFYSIYGLTCIIVVILYILFPIVHTYYQVTISEDVKFSEFQEKYKIIKQDGKIFTVEERKK